MKTVYLYYADGYYASESDHYGGPLPNNSTFTAPEIQEGYVPHWNGTAWDQVENHKGKEGYVKGERTTINDYGPLPPSWSDTPPPPTLDQALAAKLGQVMGGYAAAFADMEKIYPQHEREGWVLQEAEALALLADPSAQTPVLSALVAMRGRGETELELADKVLANANTWRMYYAWYTGQQQRMYAEVLALAVLPDIEDPEEAAQAALAAVAALQAYQVTYAPAPV